MEQDFSLIIPARNAEKTLERALRGVLASGPRPSEIIVVNDGSSDATPEIAKRFGCRIVHIDSGKGPMQARFAGARAASFPYLVFMDADVLLPPGALARILHSLAPGSGIDAVTGVLARLSPVKGFFSHYKNEYMNFIFSRKPCESLFLYGSIWALKKEELIFFEPVSEPFGSLVSDSEMGFKLSLKNKKILLDKNLRVRHLKEYSLLSLIKNDFVIPFMFSCLFTKYAYRIPWIRERGFSHASMGQALITMASFMSFFALAAWVFTGGRLWAGMAGLTLAGVLIYWRFFLSGLSGRGGGFVLKTAITAWFTGGVMFAGMMGGMVYSLFVSPWKQCRIEKVKEETSPWVTENRTA